MVGQSRSKQAALRDIIMSACAAMKKHQRFVFVQSVRVPQQRQPADISADGANFGLKNIGLYMDCFSGCLLNRLLGNGCRRCRCWRSPLGLWYTFINCRALLDISLRMLVTLPTIPNQP